MPAIFGFYARSFLVQPYYMAGNQISPVRKKAYFFAYGKFTEGDKLAGLLKEFDAVNYNLIKGIQFFQAKVFGHFSKLIDSIIT